MRRSIIALPPALLLSMIGVLTNAQSCNNVTTTLSAPADFAAIATCTTFTGSIVIATDLATSAELNGVQQINGDITVANNSAITDIGADSLEIVTGTVILDNLPLLANISLPKWSAVGTIRLNEIPPPTSINMQTTVQQVSNLYITNTTLEVLFGILLRTSQMENLVVTGNKFLSNCWFGVGNITQGAIITGNTPNMGVTLPDLTNAYSIQINNASSIEMPFLKSVNQDLTIEYNGIQNLSLPNLSFVGGDLDITHNNQMTAIILDELVNIQGDLTISNNSELGTVGGLPVLSYIGGDLTVEGEYDNVSLPLLHSVRGNLDLYSEEAFTCSDVPESIIEGTYTCNGHASGKSSSAGASVPAGAIVGAVIGGVVILGAVLAVAAFCVRRRILRREANRSVSPIGQPPEYGDIKDDTRIKETELMSYGSRTALAHDREVREERRYELETSHSGNYLYELPSSMDMPPRELRTSGST